MILTIHRKFKSITHRAIGSWNERQLKIIVITLPIAFFLVFYPIAASQGSGIYYSPFADLIVPCAYPAFNLEDTWITWLTYLIVVMYLEMILVAERT